MVIVIQCVNVFFLRLRLLLANFLPVNKYFLFLMARVRWVPPNRKCDECRNSQDFIVKGGHRYLLNIINLQPLAIFNNTSKFKTIMLELS